MFIFHDLSLSGIFWLHFFFQHHSYWCLTVSSSRIVWAHCSHWHQEAFVPPPPLPPTLNSKIWKLRQTKISFCVLQGSHHRRCRRPGGLCTNWMHSWPNTELHCMLRKMNYDHRIAVSVFCACAGICPIFKAKNTLEIVCNLSRTCVVEIGWSFYLHLHRFLRFPQTSDSYAFTLS